MSASDKKKLRKEQTAASTTEKQQTEKKNQKKQTAMTVTFIVAMVLVLAIFLGTVLSAPIKNLRISTSHAVTVNDHSIGGQEFNYFYMDSVSNFFSNFQQYGSYATMMLQVYGFDPNTALGDQIFDEATGTTWADYFTSAALESAKWTYAMYDEAQKAGFTLTEDQQKSLTTFETNLKTYAEQNSMSVNKYIKNIYGNVASFDSYLEYYKLSMIASSYASEYYSDLEFSDDDLRGYEKDKYHEYSSYSYATATITVSDYLTGGTKVTDEDGKTTTTYSDEEKQAALDAALADAKKLSEDTTIVSVDTFNTALDAIKEDKTCTEVDETLFTSLSISNEDMEDWLISDDRKEGDRSYFANTTTTDDVETVVTYTVILYLGCNENTSYEGNVLHLLVEFEGGTKDESGNTTYSQEEKDKAHTEALKLLDAYKNGEQTKDAFIALLKEHTDDVDSKGNPNNDGLYENIYPGSGYVDEFEKWAYADHEVGDTGIIETTYGYHVMYYVGDGENTYRDMLIETDMKDEAYEKWETALLEAITTKDGKPVVNDDFIVPSSYYTSSYSY